MMTPRETSLLQEIDQRTPELVDLACQLIAAPSPNPPGDVTRVMTVAREYLSAHGVPLRRLRASSALENVIATVDGRVPGRTCVLNAHLDTFPVESQDPFSSIGSTAGIRQGLRGGRIHGRGACDMKGGAAAFMFTAGLLASHADEVAGRLTLCLVCDEETFGPHGSKLLLQQSVGCHGDILLSAEPSSTAVVRYGEKGVVIGHVDFAGDPAHGAYPTAAGNPITSAARFIASLETAITLLTDDYKADPVDAAEAALIEMALGAGAAGYLTRPVLNFGRIGGGVTANMQARRCRVNVDVRLPLHISASTVVSLVQSIAANFGGTYTCGEARDANVSDTGHWLFPLLTRTVHEVTGREPSLAVGIGCTDARLWRGIGVPAAVFGPSPLTMGRDDEHITVDELITVAKVHALTCWRALQPGSQNPGGRGEE
jgi:succinyl-diaminopimelate desuccinylase